MRNITLTTKNTTVPLFALVLIAGMGAAYAQDHGYQSYPADGLHPRPEERAAQTPVSANQFVGLYRGGQAADAGHVYGHPADGLHPYPTN
jgi:hypothetical protein